MRGEVPLFHASGSLSIDHDKWISDDYFEMVGSVNRFPRYKNKRMVDPQVKMFLDEHGLEINPGWELPTPNQEAAYKSLAKYGKATVVMNKQDVAALNKAWHYMSDHFYPYMRDSEVITLDAAVKQADRSTSSGCPFNQEFSKKGDLFDNDPEIMSWLEGDWIALAEDPYWTTIFSSSLKEELRPDEKIAENSQRTFAAGATDATIHGTRLFWDMNNKMYDSHLRTSSAVGMSPLKGNWDKLYQKLNVFQNGYALDESQYDSSLRSFLMWGCARFRWQCLAEKDRTQANLNRIKTYYRNLVNTLLLTPEGILLLKKLGNPSGSVNTVTDNTLILYWILAYAWIKTAPEECRTFTDFELHTSKALLGDDNTWTVSDFAHTFYNGRSVIDAWKTLGITTTTDSLDARLPEDLDFLSAHTVFLNGKAVPLYDRNKLMKSLLYAPRAHLTPETTLTRVTCLLQIGWTDLPFRKFCRDVIDWLLEEYDDILKEDERWIIAKCQIKPDDFYYNLFTGSKLLHPQCVGCFECICIFGGNCPHPECKTRRETYDPECCYCMNNSFVDYCMHCDCERELPTQSLSGDVERSETPDKAFIMSAVVIQTRKGKRNPRRPRGRGQKRAGVATVAQKGTTVVVTTKKPRRRNRRGGGQGRGPRGTRALAGKGSTRNRDNASNRRGQTVVEDEFIAAVTVANQPNFNAVKFPINIGQSATFPWGATIAKNYQKYQFDTLEFYYKREVSEFATNGQVGKVMMYFNPDAADADPTTKQQVEDSQCHSDAMPCENFRLVVPPSMLKRLNDSFYIRPGNQQANTDIKTYDVGNLFICTQGIVNNVEIGELHVHYKVRLMIPVIPGLAGAAPVNTQTAWFQDTASQVLTGGADTTLLLATATANGPGIVNTAGSFVPPVGNYLVDWLVDFATDTSSNMTGTIAFKKNGTTVYVTNPQYKGTTLGAAQSIVMSGSCFVTANGTDAFILTANIVVGGIITADAATLRWTSV